MKGNDVRLIPVERISQGIKSSKEENQKDKGEGRTKTRSWMKSIKNRENLWRNGRNKSDAHTCVPKLAISGRDSRFAKVYDEN